MPSPSESRPPEPEVPDRAEARFRARMKFDDLETEALVRCPAGHPLVLRCHPLRRPAAASRPIPFPTLFWLACPAANTAVAAVEREGGVRAVQALLAENEAFRERVHGDHRRYAEERASMLSAADRADVERLGFAPALLETGIGGIRDPDTVKCLHLHYAHHLARGSAIGAWVEARMSWRPCGTTAQ